MSLTLEFYFYDFPLTNFVYRAVEVEDAHPVKQHLYRMSRVIVGMCFAKLVVRV